MRSPLTALLGAWITSLVIAQEPADAGRWHCRELPDGTSLWILQIADSPKQATFTIFGCGLAHDPAGRAQFSHLAEHMVLRATDPDRLHAGDLSINGETTADALRLETFASPEKGAESFDRHVRWLASREDLPVDEKVLAVEKVRIEGELKATVPRGFSHKWAMAGWSQAVRGCQHARVRGDVDDATPEQVRAWWSERADDLDVCIVSVGPLAPEDVVLAFAGVGEGVPEGAEEPSPVDEGEPTTAEPVQEATWDIDAHHRMWWWPVDGAGDTASRAAVRVAARLLVMRLHSDPGLKAADATHGLVEIVEHDGRLLVLVDTTIGPDTDIGALDEALRDTLRRGPTVEEVTRTRDAMVGQLRVPANLAVLRERLGARGHLVEGNIALQISTHARAFGVSPDQLTNTLEAVDPKRVVELWQCLAECGPETLRLHPR